MSSLWTFTWCVWQSCFRRKADVQPGNGQWKEGAFPHSNFKWRARQPLTAYRRPQSQTKGRGSSPSFGTAAARPFFLTSPSTNKKKTVKRKKTNSIRSFPLLIRLFFSIMKTFDRAYGGREGRPVVSQVVALQRVLSVKRGVAVGQRAVERRLFAAFEPHVTQ